MKKQLILVGSLFLTAVITWLIRASINSEEPIQHRKIIWVNDKQKTEIVKVVNQLIVIYNKQGVQSLRKIFPNGNVPAKVWKLSGVEDPIAKSLNTLADCGKDLRLQSPQVLKVNNSAKNNHSYIVKATVNKAGDMLEFRITKRKKYFSLAGISKVQS